MTLFEKQKKQAIARLEYWLSRGLCLAEAVTRAKKECWGIMVWAAIEKERIR